MILKKFHCAKKKRSLNLVSASVAELGFERGAGGPGFRGRAAHFAQAQAAAGQQFGHLAVGARHGVGERAYSISRSYCRDNSLRQMKNDRTSDYLCSVDAIVFSVTSFVAVSSC